MKASDLFIKCLEEEGVEYIFGIPGEENLDFLESLRASKIKFILTRHEQAAAFMAATYGRLTLRAGVVLTTLGPGATNLLTGLAYAQMGGMPLIAITGQKPIKKSKQGMFQKVNIIEIAKPVTKMSRSIEMSDKIPVLVRRAFRAAEAERPGAVILELPEDIAREKTSELPLSKTLRAIPYPSGEFIEKTCKMIEKAKHPVIVIGADAGRASVVFPLKQFITKTSIPFTTTQMGKGIDETSLCYIGTTALSQNDYIHKALEHADLIITIGHTIREKPPFIPGASKQTLIHIGFTSADISHIYQPDIEITGDIAITLSMLASAITPSTSWDFSYFHKVHDELIERIKEEEGESGWPIKPQYLVGALKKAVPDDVILALDNGMYKIWLSRNFPARLFPQILLDNALASMGAGLPSAIAAKLVYPKRKVICICGDGGFMMNSQELETARRLGLDLTILILNDNAFGMIKWKQKEMGLPEFGLDFGNPDFVKYADAYGLQGFRLGEEDDLIQKLNALIKLPGINILEIPINYD